MRSSGNYVYTVSEREIEKLCLGLDLPHVYFKGLNDVYVPGGECVPAKWKSIEFLRMRLFIALSRLPMRATLVQANTSVDLHF